MQSLVSRVSFDSLEQIESVVQILLLYLPATSDTNTMQLATPFSCHPKPSRGQASSPVYTGRIRPLATSNIIFGSCPSITRRCKARDGATDACYWCLLARPVGRPACCWTTPRQPRVLDGAGDTAQCWLVALSSFSSALLVVVGLAEDRRGQGPPPAVPSPRPPRRNHKLAWILNEDNPDGTHRCYFWAFANFCVGRDSRRLLNWIKFFYRKLNWINRLNFPFHVVVQAPVAAALSSAVARARSGRCREFNR
jgi:hypothetical protein